MIKIKNAKKIDITPPSFLCDYELTKNLQEYPQFSHLNKFNTTAILGKPGSGKTSMLISILSQKGDDKIYHKVFDFVYIFMPSQSRASLKKNIFEKHHPSRLFDELTLQNLQSVYDAIEENSTNKKTSLIVYDDCGAVLKQKEIQMLLKKLSFNRRHLKVVQLFLIQSWLSVPLTIRKLFSNLICFKPSRKEWSVVVSETLEQDEDVSDALLGLYKDPHDYLFLSITNQKIYLNQNEVEIIEDEEN
jgi:KaiC/GvpD/RAD55 family RecA-like ATPase